MKHREFLQLQDPLIRRLWVVDCVLGVVIIVCTLWVFVAANLARSL